MRQVLDELIAREACAEILSLLQPEERAIAALRVQGFDDGQIGGDLGLERSTVCRRMLRAQQRIAEQRPDLAGLLAGRRRSSGLRPPGAAPDDAGPGPGTKGGTHVEMETDPGHPRSAEPPSSGALRHPEA